MNENKRFWWRMRATDGWETTDWSAVVPYYINCKEESPRIALPLSPSGNGGALYTLRPTFTWRSSSDPDPLDTIRYEFQIASDSNYVIKFDTIISSTTLTLPEDLAYGRQYWWRTIVIDRTGRMSRSPSLNFQVYQLGDLTGDLSTDIGDLTRLVGYLFVDFEPLQKPELGDFNGDCNVDILDLTRLVDNLFMTFVPLEPGCQPPPPE